jgi:hypothetical protein
MSLRGYGVGNSSDGNDFSIGATSLSNSTNLLNTPLADTMKKIGMKP